MTTGQPNVSSSSVEALLDDYGLCQLDSRSWSLLGPPQCPLSIYKYAGNLNSGLHTCPGKTFTQSVIPPAPCVLVLPDAAVSYTCWELLAPSCCRIGAVNMRTGKQITVCEGKICSFGAEQVKDCGTRWNNLEGCQKALKIQDGSGNSTGPRGPSWLLRISRLKNTWKHV